MKVIYNDVELLMNNNELIKAELLLQSIKSNTAQWHNLYGKLLILKAWFDEAKTHLEFAINLEPNNLCYKEDLLLFIGRHRRYSDPYYDGGYRRKRGCSCCCCDDCCCDCNISCCDLICLDSCCECLGGDLIECI